MFYTIYFKDQLCIKILNNVTVLLKPIYAVQGVIFKNDKFQTLESPYHLVAVSGAHFTQGTILIVILVSSGSAKSRTHQSAVGGFLVTRRGWPGRLRACRIWTFINSV